jgi:uncharacterized protein YcbK (DUF882 family)
MGDLSKNFSRSEFACTCGCGFDTVDAALLGILQALRDHFGESVTVTSGCRCEAHNAAVGGAENSMHLTGKAADTVVDNVSPEDVYCYLFALYPDTCGIGLYEGWVHLDSRTERARWGS